MKDFICLLCSFPNEYNHFENKIPIYPVHCFNLISLNTTWNVFWMNKLLKQVWLFLSIFFGLKRQKNLKWQKKKKKMIGFIVKELIFELKRFLPQNKVIRMPASALSLWGQLHHQVLCNGSFSKQVSCFSPRAQPISSWSCPCHINLITCQKKEAA